MVVSAHRLASEVGIEMLRRGGNAIDAAVAVGYALAVVDPCCGNIGGGGFMVARMADGREVFLNFRETAPAAATRDMYLDANGDFMRGASLYGWRAVAVPGTVLGLDTALTRYGTLPRDVVMAPAIRLAHDGFPLNRFDAAIIAHSAARLAQQTNVARIFLRPDGTPLQAGDTLQQPDLSLVLQSIADAGPDAFYRGRIPIAAETASLTSGGVLTAADFSKYRVTESAPLHCAYRGYTLLLAPPPSSGGVTLCEILHVLEAYDLHAFGFHGAQSVHLMVEAMRHAYRDRNTYLGDPAFVKNPIDRLLSDAHIAGIRAQIGDRATPSSTLPPAPAPHEGKQTTHFSVVDQAGNTVAVTYTLNAAFGAGVMAYDTGFMLNDEMDDFTTRPGAPNLFGLVQGEANAIAPGKRPLSSMSPTIVLRDGQPSMVLGSPGGARIISIVLETFLNMVDHGMAPQQAVDAPRLHHQWLPDEVFAEPFALSPDTQLMLQAMGYRIRQQPPWGAAELIVVGPRAAGDTGAVPESGDFALSGKLRPGLFYGASDPRRPNGAAVGY